MKKQNMSRNYFFYNAHNILFAIFLLVIPTRFMHAQEPPLPAGTSSVDSEAAAASKPSLVEQAEDAIMHGQLQKAIPLLSSVVARTPNNARALYDLGYAEQRTEHPEIAVADFEKAIAADPKQYEARAALARLDAIQGKLAEARKQLEMATTLTPAEGNPTETKARAFRLLAQVDRQLHDPAAAAEALIAALNLSPEHPEDMLLTAQLAEEQGDVPGAETEYHKVLAAVPSNDPLAEEATGDLVRTLISEKKFGDAEPLIRQKLTQHPEDAALIAQLATVLAEQGKTEEAITSLAKLHEKYPNQPEITRMLADLYTQAGAASKADPLYVQLLAQGKPDASLLTARGENLIRQQHYEEAVPVLQQAVAMQQDLPDTWSDLALAASQAEQYPLVIEALRHRANYRPDGPATFFLRATALDHLHQTQAAMTEYQKFIQSAQHQYPSEVLQAKQRLTQLSEKPRGKEN